MSLPCPVGTAMCTVTAGQRCQGQLQEGIGQGWGTLGLEGAQQHSHVHLWEEL